jgi:hypothetical protein
MPLASVRGAPPVTALSVIVAVIVVPTLGAKITPGADAGGRYFAAVHCT